MSRDAWVGIDVACAKNKRLPIVICIRQNDRLVPLDLRTRSDFVPPIGIGNVKAMDQNEVITFTESASRYVKNVANAEGFRIRRIGIDAPSSYANEQTGRRSAEVAVNRAGIRCFQTPTKRQFDEAIVKAKQHLDGGGLVANLPNANRLWMLVGFSLYETFSRLAECREAYPYAAVYNLGAADVYKTKREGLAAQAKAVSGYTGWPEHVDELADIGYGQLHDNLDAYICAWIASQQGPDLEAFGDPPDDVIWAPKPDLANVRFAKSRTRDKRKGTTNSDKGRLCPACKEHFFKRWPWGWDAHAAYRCSGLKLGDPEARKQEFRDRFL